MTVRGAALAAAIGALLLSARAAAAAPNADPLRFWSVTKVEQGAGEVPAASGAQLGGVLNQLVDLGHVAFNLPGTPSFDRASGLVFSSADGAHYYVEAEAPVRNPSLANSVKGGVTHLDEYQAYEKRSGDASLRITIKQALMQTVDANLGPDEADCPPTIVRCWPLRSIVRFHARAYASSSGGDFFNVDGIAFIKGRNALWDHWVATTADSQAPVWSDDNFIFNPDVDDSGTFSNALMGLDRPPKLKVPLASVRTGELFAVHVSLEAEAVDDRGRESAVDAFIRDPQERDPALLQTRGLKPLGKPRFKEPAVRALGPARCPGGTPRRAGTLQLGDAAFSASESSGDPLVVVTRTGGLRGTASVTLRTRGGTAQSGSDFRSTTKTVRFGNGDDTPRLVTIPLREDGQIEPAETFKVGLSGVRCAHIGARRTAPVTILDDDQPPTPPPAESTSEFTIGGTVDGLQGSGLVLSDLGEELPVSSNGAFTFSGTRSAGQPYEVAVKTQPHNPPQTCSVLHGSGTVSTSDVSDTVVHCETLPTPSGLDPTFGDLGTVSTPLGNEAHGEAVVIQPTGGIVTAGWRRELGGGADFALTRHDPTGRLDPSFGAGGIVTTDLGGADDEAYDAALLGDGGIVVVGRTDAAGTQRTDFGLVRYRADGSRNQGFGSDGIVRTDLAGGGEQANAVAVQPDGKIVVTGFRTAASLGSTDLLTIRYNADGTLDTDFGTGGVVTTDLGTSADAARALAIQPDGRILVAGVAEDNLALVRYTSDGKLDPDFGSGGITISNIGPANDVANGVALTPSGEIVVAGETLNAKPNRDFLVARYHDDGSIDTAFGPGGVVRTDVGGRDDTAENLALDSQGRIVVVGRTLSPTISDMALVRYHPDGTVDTSFDGDGIVTADFHGSGEFGQDVAIDPDGRILAAGYTANGSNIEFALIRANP